MSGDVPERSTALALPAPSPQVWEDARLQRLWLATQRREWRSLAVLAASTGVEGAEEVVKYLLAGADVVMSTSALLRHGVAHMKVLLDGLESWLVARGLDTLAPIRGRMSQCNLTDPTAFERANYIKILQSFRMPMPV